MTVPTFKMCRRCAMIQQASLAIVGFWLAWGAQHVTDAPILRLTLQVCAMLTLAAAARFRIAAIWYRLRGE